MSCVRVLVEYVVATVYSVSDALSEDERFCCWTKEYEYVIVELFDTVHYAKYP